MRTHLLRHTVYAAVAATLFSSLVSAKSSKLAPATPSAKTFAVLYTSETLGNLKPCG